MISREDIIPTKYEYNLSRNLPKRSTSKPLIPSGPTLNQQSKGIPEVEDVSVKEDDQPIDEYQKLIELMEKARIRTLETEVSFLKMEFRRVDYDSRRLKEENERLLNENKDLKKIKLELESQNDQLKQRYSENHNGHMSLVEVENLKRNQQVLLRLKENNGNSDTENALLAEISRLQEQVSASESNTKILEAEVSLLKKKRSTLKKQYHALRRNHEDCTTKKKADQTEIERLQKRIDELQAENKLLKEQVYEAEENSKYQSEYELVLLPQIQAEIERLENEKSFRELQLQTYKTDITALENRVSLLRTDLGILQKKRDEISTEVEGWESQIKNNEDNKKSRAQAEKNLVKEKERASEFERKLILVSSANERLNSVINSREQENEFLRKRMSEATQEHQKQQEKLKKQLEDTFNQILGGFVIE